MLKFDKQILADVGAQKNSFEHVSVVLSKYELSAVEGWKSANNIKSTTQALRELVRLGLLSEISQSYELVKSVRQTTD